MNGNSNIARYEDFRKRHHTYINLYKDLFDDVAVFSSVPDKFIKEVSPVVEEYIEKANYIIPAEQRLQMEVIREFIKRFYQFIDLATEMFEGHQTLATQTAAYMQRVSDLNKKNDKKLIEECEAEYVELLPELNGLNAELLKVRTRVDATRRDLKSIRPIWVKIKFNLEMQICPN